jgi:hypothetical protein
LIAGGGGRAFRAAEPHPVSARVGELDGVEECRDVRASIGGLADFVQQLGGHRFGGDRAAGARVFGDDRGAIGVDFGDRKARRLYIVDFSEERVIAAGRLRPAFEDVPGRGGAGERRPIVPGPIELGRGRADDQRRVRHPAGDDDVGSVPETGGDAPGTEVGVGGERPAKPKLPGPRQQVVALDVADLDVESEAAGDVTQPSGQRGGVEAAGVGDDGHTALVRQAETFLHLPQECGRVAGVRVFEFRSPEDEHGQFGEVVAGEHVEWAAVQHFANRAEAVAIKSRSVADPQRRPWSHGCTLPVAGSGEQPGHRVARITVSQETNEG